MAAGGFFGGRRLAFIGPKICVSFSPGLWSVGATQTNLPKLIPAVSAGNGVSRLTKVKRPMPGKRMKSKPSLMVPLAKGQLWKMQDKHIEIMEVGKTLTHYRLFQNQKRVPISLGGITAVQAYLRANRAKLVRKTAPVKA
jgi:hypothetical protein